MKIKIPEGYELPEDTTTGDTIEELTTFRVEDGYLVPMMIAGMEISGGESEDEKSSADTEEDTAEQEAAPMGAGPSPMKGMGERIMGMA